MPHLSLAREIKIDGTLKIELVDNEMSYEDSVRVFNYVKSSHYNRGYYSGAEKGFQKIVDYAVSGRKSAATGFFRRLTGKDHDDFDMKDDALYYIGKCKYHGGSRGAELEIFEQVYHLYPGGSVMKSGQLRDTLLNILNKETRDFDRMMRIYHFIAKISHKYGESAMRIIEKKADKKHVIRWKFREDISGCRIGFKAGKFECNEYCLYKYLRRKGRFTEDASSEHYKGFANHIWNYFYSLDDINRDQMKSIISLVEKNGYLDRASVCYLDIAENFYKPHIVAYKEVVEIRPRDLLEATGINLLDIGKEEKDDDI